MITQAGFFAIMEGCNKACNCDPFGSLNMSCDIETGQCPCRPNITGSMCNRPEPGYYYSPLDDVTFDAEEVNFSSVSVSAQN